MDCLITGPDKDVLQELADCRQYCAEGLAESEACGDVEVQAEFFIQGALLNLMEGKNLHHTIGLLQVRGKLYLTTTEKFTICWFSTAIVYN